MKCFDHSLPPGSVNAGSDSISTIIHAKGDKRMRFLSPSGTPCYPFAYPAQQKLDNSTATDGYLQEKQLCFTYAMNVLHMNSGLYVPTQVEGSYWLHIIKKHVSPMIFSAWMDISTNSFIVLNQVDVVQSITNVIP